jgi:hypothetical protein
MRTSLNVSIAVLALVAVGSVLAGSIAHLMLTWRIDSEAVRKKTGRSKFWLVINPTTPKEFFVERGHSIWTLRYVCLKLFQIAAGLLAIALLLLARYA